MSPETSFIIVKHFVLTAKPESKSSLFAACPGRCWAAKDINMSEKSGFKHFTHQFQYNQILFISAKEQDHVNCPVMIATIFSFPFFWEASLVYKLCVCSPPETQVFRWTLQYRLGTLLQSRCLHEWDSVLLLKVQKENAWIWSNACH